MPGIRAAIALLGVALIASAVVSMSFSVPGRAEPGASLDLADYHETFSDTFASLNVSARGPGTRWIAHTPWNGDFGDAVFDDPGANGPFSAGPGGLAITAHRDSAGRWHSGLLCSMDSDGPGAKGFAQQYGYFEMKAQLPSGSGTWPAFWLIGVHKQVSAAEIDVIEYYGGFPRYYHSVEHVWQQGTDRLHLDHLNQVPAGSLSAGYNTYGVLITPDQTIFYLNRHEIWATATQPEFRQPMYLLVNLAIGGGWPTKNLASPSIMRVAYIKVYQKNP
jgi:hypothetical protein